MPELDLNTILIEAYFYILFAGIHFFEKRQYINILHYYLDTGITTKYSVQRKISALTVRVSKLR